MTLRTPTVTPDQSIVLPDGCQLSQGWQYDTIVFEVPIHAVPDPRGRKGRGGHWYKPDNGHRPFKDAVILFARAAARANKIRVCKSMWWTIYVECIFNRPKSHLLKSGKPSTKWEPFPTHKNGDWDNLAKGAQDAITESGAWWSDDTRVVDGRGSKRYAEPGELARTIITITRLV